MRIASGQRNISGSCDFLFLGPRDFFFLSLRENTSLPSRVSKLVFGFGFLRFSATKSGDLLFELLICLIRFVAALVPRIRCDEPKGEVILS